MVIDYTKFNNLTSSDSEEGCHPNIDLKSWKRLRRQQKQEKKENEKLRLDFLSKKEFLTENEREELNKLKRKNEMILRETVSFSPSEKNSDEFVVINDLILEPTIKNYINFVRKYSLDSLDNSILFNLIEALKNEEEDEIVFVLGKLAMYGIIGRRGQDSLLKLEFVVENDENMKRKFEEDVVEYIEKARRALMKNGCL